MNPLDQDQELVLPQVTYLEQGQDLHQEVVPRLLNLLALLRILIRIQVVVRSTQIHQWKE